MGSSDHQTEKKKKTKRARLGRGLGALIDQGGAPSVSIDVGANPPRIDKQNTNILADSTDQQADAGGQRILELAIDEIVPNPHQPRRVFDEEALSVLAESIRTHGLMQPVVVREAGDGGYELVAGERRWRATKLAGLGTIRALLSEADDARSAELALIENIQRADLNPIERAMGFAQLIERFGLTQQQLSERVGMSRSGVANLIRLLELDAQLRELIARGELSVGHAKVLLSCDDPSRRALLADECMKHGWTVRLLESKLGDAASKNREPSKSADPRSERVTSVLRDLENRMSEELGTRVVLQTNAKGTKGRISIEFYDLDQFDGLMQRLGVATSDAM
jgi:ParB family chromosome partitioning protein